MICEAAAETEASDVISSVTYFVFGGGELGGLLRMVPITWPSVFESSLSSARPRPREAPITAVVGIFSWEMISIDNERVI